MLLLIVLLLIIYDIMISKRDEEVKKNKIKEVKKQEKQEEEKKNSDPNEDCLYKINDDNDNCTLKNGCFKSNQCKLHVSSIENLHPTSYDWSSLDIKY